jgi:predicted dinucleotide-binding enzyme
MPTTLTGKLVRKQFLISPGQVEKLDRLARSERTSVAEIVRSAIDNYDPDVAAFNDLDSQHLMELAATRLKEAIASTRKANRNVDKALKKLTKRSS